MSLSEPLDPFAGVTKSELEDYVYFIPSFLPYGKV